MKLLFLWIECSQNGFIKESGFNIAGNYIWKYDINTNTLTHRKKLGYIENFWGNNIEDLTVIVGENGAGKSTVLCEVFKYDSLLKINNNYIMSSPMPRECKIIVYEKEGCIYYDHNLEKELFVKPFISKKTISNHDTKIFVSNSIEKIVGSVGYNGEGLCEYSLTDFTISSQAKQILNTNRIGGRPWYSPSDDRENEEDKIRELNELIHIDGDAYNILNAFLTLFFLIKSPSEQYMGKTYTNVDLHVKAEEEVYGNRRSQEQIADFNNLKKLSCKIGSDNSLFNLLTTYYFFELVTYFGSSFLAKIEIHSLKEIKSILEQRLNERKRTGIKSSIEYFIDAVDDLILFEQLIDENEIISQDAMNINIESYKYLQVNLRKNKTFFDRIFMFFKEKRPSFLLRYTSFKFHNLSSGEEALLKLYSRIFWLYSAERCRNKSLILIDEIDLYMHPKWQRNLVNCLVEDMGKLIGEESKAQIIITSHSPIFLSDIPKANVLFLVNKENQCVVDDSNYHRDTFGNNVHTLFLDSFFLDKEGTMGAFAEKKINEILRVLHSESKINDENKKILKIINCIGDQLIKQKLLELYEKNQQIQPQLESAKSLNNVQINNTIIMLEKQIRELQNMIAQLEQIRND